MATPHKPYWENPTQEKILRSAQYWEPQKGATQKFQWHLEPEFSPWELFLTAKKPYRIQDWKKWLLEEIESQQEDERYAWEDLTLNHPIEEPIVIANLSKKPIPEIWDGWHRTASCFLYTRPHLPAIIGNPR